MGFTANLMKKIGGGSSNEEESRAYQTISKNFPVGEITEEDCAACECKQFPNSLKVDDAPLFESAPPTHAQILVATGQTNWQHDIADESSMWGQICRRLGKSADELGKLVGGKVRINGTDMEFDEDDKTVSLVVVPQFIKIQTTPDKCVDDIKAVLQVKPGSELKPEMKSLKDQGFIMLCSHRTRDKRCGITAPLMKAALATELQRENLLSNLDDDEDEGIKIVLCNHVGGHKFVANALIYKNNGTALMFARLRPEHAHAVVQKTILNDIVFPKYTRACAKLEAYNW